jgi:hypothetical protein|tara:strand:+ start:129 stop:419 length:291 start_codon:yes stop_codon:yes gene_type:complete
MNISTVSILGRQYDVVVVDALSSTGLCDYEAATISIKSGQVKHREADTLLHECVHAIDECMQTNLTERQVYCITVGILALIKNNPHVLTYINESIK